MSVPEEDEELIDKFQREFDGAWKDITDGQVISSHQLKQKLGAHMWFLDIKFTAVELVETWRKILKEGAIDRDDSARTAQFFYCNEFGHELRIS